MAIQIINIGTTANDTTGEALRNAFDKTNQNFVELYNLTGGSGVNLAFFGKAVRAINNNGNVELRPNGTGIILLQNVHVSGNTISSSNGDLVL